MTSLKKRPHPTKEQAKQIRMEYATDPKITIEFLADKYERSDSCILRILNNKSHPDPSYQKPEKRKGSPFKKSIYLPEHIKEAKDHLTPAPTTAHRARGQNRVINKYS